MTAPTLGLVADMDETEYHRHPALSVSGAKRLLQAPALYWHDRQNPPAPKDVFDVGTATHRVILGVGPDLVEIPADDWRSKAAKEARDAARAEGKVALLSSQMREVEAMAAAIQSHDVARALLSADDGIPEASLFWTDEETGVPCRGRLDMLSAWVSDVKTCASSHPDKFERDAYNFGYHLQAAHYLDGIAANGYDAASFFFIAVEKTPPYLVTVFEPDADLLRAGRERMREAKETYARCIESGEWPGYSSDVVRLSLPRWAA